MVTRLFQSSDFADNRPCDNRAIEMTSLYYTSELTVVDIGKLYGVTDAMVIYTVKGLRRSCRPLVRPKLKWRKARKHKRGNRGLAYFDYSGKPYCLVCNNMVIYGLSCNVCEFRTIDRSKDPFGEKSW